MSAQNATGIRRTARLVGGVGVVVLAVVCLAGAGWALWLDRIDRDAGGYLAIATTRNVHTDTYALVAPLHGDGPGWLYGPTILGTARVRSTSLTGQPEFIGVARTSDVDSYLQGVGLATIDHLATGDVTPRSGHAPATPPAQVPIWAASTTGTGTHTLVWTPRSGDWSVVVMNAGGSAGVAVRGDVAATMPPLTWIWVGLGATGLALGALGTWMIVGARRRHQSGASAQDYPPAPTPPEVPAVGASR